MRKKEQALERAVQGVFLLLGLVTVGCVALITVYLILSGIPAIRRIGLPDFLLGMPGRLPRPAAASRRWCWVWAGPPARPWR